MLCAPYARAQSAAEEAQQELGVQAGTRVRLAYDDNLLRLDDRVAPGPGRSKDDVVTSAMAYVRFRLSPSMQTIAGTAEYGRDFHAENSFLDRERVAANVRWDWRITPRCSGVAQAGYSRSQGDLSDQVDLVANAREVVDLAASGGCEVGSGWRPTAHFRRTDVSNSNPSQAGADSRVTAFGGGLSYRRTKLAGAEIGYRRIEIDYPNRTDPLTGRQSHVAMDVLLGGLNFRFADRLSIALSGSHHWIAGDGGRSDRAFAGGANIAADINANLRVDLLAAREIQVPNYVRAAYVVNDRLELGTSYRVSAKTRLSLRGGYERNQFRAPQVSPSGNLRTFDERKYVTLEARYRPLRSLDLNFQYRYVDRNTDSLFGSYSGNRFVIEAILAI
jgi:hypothetical protein